MHGLKEIPSAPGYFAELSSGRIFSARRGDMKLLRGGTTRGYKIHSLMIDGRQVTKAAHRLVCEAAWGECPPGMECCHINGDKGDNRAVNLRWATPSENNGADKRQHGRLRFGENHQNAVLSETKVKALRARRAKGETCRSLAMSFGVSPTTVSRIARHLAWGHL
jgi:hypothetical protein